VGVDNDKQQIDIYPTILDMIDMTNLLEAGVVVCLTRIAVPPLQSIQQEQFINLRRAITSVPLMVKNVLGFMIKKIKLFNQN
jgi:hypothetical protein